MCEITNKNFHHFYNQIKQDIQSSKFIAIDTEFSGLSTTNSESSTTSLFDKAEERYGKLLNLAKQIIPLQVGITTFLYNANQNEYIGKAYTFYVFPRSFFTINRSFLCQASSLQFLNSHNFDFNKFVYEGVSYLNRDQELELKNIFDGNNDSNVCERLLIDYNDVISQWFYNAKNGDVFEVKDVLGRLAGNYEAIYVFHRSLREKYYQKLWTYEENDVFFIKRVMPDEYAKLCKENSLEERIHEELLGFSRVFQLICRSGKPLVGHNLLMDLILMVHTFDKPLPNSYKKFKSYVATLLPEIYDTRTLSFELQHKLPKEKLWQYGSLENLYLYFKDGLGRHLSPMSPLIQPHVVNSTKDEFHNAGWDSYFTGYIFLRMAHTFVSDSNKNVKRYFMFGELLHAIAFTKNRINVIRCAIPYIQMDGDDPVSTRPPFLVIESSTNEPIQLRKVQNILSSCGMVEVKSLSNKGKRAIVAVDNYMSHKRILKEFQTNANFRVERYSVLKHSQSTKYVLWSTVIASAAAMLFWWSVKKN